MKTNERKYYIDNLRWLIVLVLIPYHTAQAWNTWGEPNYIYFERNRLISSIIVFFSPYFMPLLFLLAGISTRYALQKRTCKEYIVERAKRLLLPFTFGTIVIMPVMCYLGDKFNYSYDGGFFRHYSVFFTKFTDLTGADGGFSFGQFWFCLYLFVISAIVSGVLALIKYISEKTPKIFPFGVVILLGLPLPLLSEILSIAGKSLAEYTYLFLLGYFVFSNEKTIESTQKCRYQLLGIGFLATFLNVYLFLWCDKEYIFLNTALKFMSEWFMILALMGIAKGHLNFTGKVSDYMSKRSFLFYTWHFIWVVSFQYLLFELVGNNTIVLFAGTVILSYLATFICTEISIRIPLLCFVTGTKYNKYQ